MVFGTKLMTAGLANRFGALRVGLAGILWLLTQGSTPAPIRFMAAVTLFLGGMGLINPIGSAITLEPFGDRAGAALALLGFLQWGWPRSAPPLSARWRPHPRPSWVDSGGRVATEPKTDTSPEFVQGLPLIDYWTGLCGIWVPFEYKKAEHAPFPKNPGLM